MKPENAKQLPVDSDLTGVALYRAQEIIQTSLEPEYKYKLYWVLRVPSQTMGEAIKFAYLLGLNVEVDFTYLHDEWSLSGSRFTSDGQTTETVWSPGA